MMQICRSHAFGFSQRITLNAICAALSVWFFATPAAAEADPWALCAHAAATQEAAYAIPDSLLHSIAMAESGRRNPATGEAKPWPWTVMAERRGRYLATKDEAIAEVQALQARGVRNIDVGCMQVNLHHHGDAFPDLETAFDPFANAEYAAQFLSALHAEVGGWTRAVGFYHSRTTRLYKRYRKKVLNFWLDDRPDPGAPAVAEADVDPPEKNPATPLQTASLPAPGFGADPETSSPSQTEPTLTDEEIAERRLARMRLLRASADARRGLADVTIERNRAMHAATIERQRALLEAYRERLKAVSEAMRGEQ